MKKHLTLKHAIFAINEFYRRFKVDEGKVRNQTRLAARTGLTRSRITLSSIPESQEMRKMSRMAPSWSQESEHRGQNANKQ